MKERNVFAGESKYPLKDAVFAFDGITLRSALSLLKFWQFYGLIVCVAAVIAAIYTLVSKFLLYPQTAGRLSCVQFGFWAVFSFVSIGIIGEYIGKIYKKNPRLDQDT